jgi:hypothetical protein
MCVSARARARACVYVGAIPVTTRAAKKAPGCSDCVCVCVRARAIPVTTRAAKKAPGCSQVVSFVAPVFAMCAYNGQTDRRTDSK